MSMDVLLVWVAIGWAVVILADRPVQTICGLVFQFGVIIMMLAKSF